jgi:hypothetical protein
MTTNRLFAIVFEHSLHPEVIKKSSFLLEFMNDHSMISIPEIDLMWDCAVKKHEAYRVAILRAISHLVSKMNPNHLRHLFIKIRDTPLQFTDKFLLNLLKAIAKTTSGFIFNGNGHHSSSNDGVVSKRLAILLGD